MRRLAGVFVAGAVMASAGCDDGSEPAATQDRDVVAVAAVPCDRPTARRGVATVVDDDLLVTAAHVVDGPLRDLAVGGRPGVVVATDERLDLALVRAEGLTGAVEARATGEPAGATLILVTPEGRRDVSILRTVRLTVDDVSDGTTVERRSHVLAGAVAGGVSGAPVLDGDRLVGVVVLAMRRVDESHAVAGDEVRAFLEAHRGDARTASTDRVSPAC